MLKSPLTSVLKGISSYHFEINWPLGYGGKNKF